MAKEKMAHQKIDSLTSLRFFAAAAIVVYHARGHFGLPSDLLGHFELSQGVSFFFVLSGFILAFVYPNLEAAGATGKFWLARFARVWPLHLATLLLYFVLLPELSQVGPLTLVANLALVQAWIPNESWFFSLNSVSWSLSTEAFFYLSFPFLIKDFDRTWPAKLGLSFMLVLAMVELGDRLDLPAWCAGGVSIHGLMYVNPLSRLCEFVLGMTACHFYRKYLVARGARPIVALGFEVLSLTGVYLLARNTAKIANWLYPLPFVQEGGYMWLKHEGVPVFAFALLIVVMAWGRGPIARILSLKPLVLLGETSFAAYLLHRLFLQYYENHFSPEQGAWPLTIYVAIVLGASFVFWSVIELPCRQLIVRGPAAVPRPSLASGLALVCIVAACFGIWSGAPLERLDLNAARAAWTADTAGNTTALASSSTPYTSATSTTATATPDSSTATAGPASRLASGGRNFGDIAFGDDLLLLATKTRKDTSGLTVTLYWQALRQQRLKNYIAVQLLSQTNVLVRLKDYRQSLREEIVEKDDCFKNELFVSASDLQNVHRFAFGLVRPAGHSPKARILRSGQGAWPDRPGLYKGLVAVELAPPILAGKQSKPVL